MGIRDSDIFAGDPTWVTEAIGGRFNDGRVKVTKTSFRFLQTLYNLGPCLLYTSIAGRKGQGQR